MLIKLVVGSAVIAAPHWLHAAMACDLNGQTSSYAYVVKSDVVDDGRSESEGNTVVRRARVVADGENAPAHVIVRRAGQGDGHAVIAGENGTTQAVNVYAMATEGDEPKQMIVEVIADNGDGQKVQLAQAVNQNGGWLGVSIKGAAENAGVEVLNVIKDSPAERAGIQAGDIIIFVDDEEVANDVPRAVSAISANDPGDEVDVVVLREGRELSFPVVLGSRKDMKTFEWKFDAAPFAEIEENVAIKGKLLQRNDAGDWVFKSLDNLEKIEDIHNHFNIDLPGSFGNMTQVWVDGEKKTVKLEIKLDDAELQIEQEDDGEITVTRVDENGDETVDVYVDEAALEANDPDAFKHYSASGKPVVIRMDVDGLKGLADLEFEFDDDDVQHVFNWKHDLHEQLMEAKEAYAEAMEEARHAYEEAMATWHDGMPGDDQEWPAMLHDHLKHLAPMIHNATQPKHNFVMTESGGIEVSIRNGD